MIEIDGATHSADEESSQDKQRTAVLNQHGYRVIRLQNYDVFNGLDEVLTLIRQALGHQD